MNCTYMEMKLRASFLHFHKLDIVGFEDIQKRLKNCNAVNIFPECGVLHYHHNRRNVLCFVSDVHNYRYSFPMISMKRYDNRYIGLAHIAQQLLLLVVQNNKPQKIIKLPTSFSKSVNLFVSSKNILDIVYI